MDIGSVEECTEMHVGGVWSIAHVEVEDDWTTVKPKKKKAEAGRSTDLTQETIRRPPGPMRQIYAVEQKKAWTSVGKGEITVDSAAEESVCPKAWGKAYPVKEPEKWLKFTNASGGSMNHYGAKEAKFKTEEGGQVMSLGFQVSDVQKPLAAVWRIAAKENLIQFGPRVEDNYIQNVMTQKKIPMVRRGGSYVVEAEFVAEESGFARLAMTR